MYRDAKEELKRLEQALLEEENRQAETRKWDLDIPVDDIPQQPEKKKNKKDKRNQIIFGLTIAVIILTAAMVGIVIFLLAGYGRWF